MEGWLKNKIKKIRRHWFNPSSSHTKEFKDAIYCLKTEKLQFESSFKPLCKTNSVLCILYQFLFFFLFVHNLLHNLYLMTNSDLYIFGDNFFNIFFKMTLFFNIMTNDIMDIQHRFCMLCQID